MIAILVSLALAPQLAASQNFQQALSTQFVTVTSGKPNPSESGIEAGS